MNREPDGYVLAASVVDTFEPQRLHPVEGFVRDLGKLLELSVMSQKPGGVVQWRLPDDVRRPAIQELARQQRLHTTLEANRGAGDESSPYQEMFERYIAGNAMEPEQQSLEQLQASLSAVQLLQGAVPNLPDAERLRAALHRQGFIRQFELLADKHFVGREEYLKTLRRFVDVLPEGFLDVVRRSSANALGNLGLQRLLHQVPLVITGMGGMGKTALLSRFLLEHLHAQADRDMLFAYIDFDKSSIWPDQPLTVLAEVAQQLALQVTEHSAYLQGLSARLVSELSVTTKYGDDYESFEAFGNLGTHGQRLEEQAIREFAAICKAAFKSATRNTLLLVFDTFEEVSQRSARHQENLLQFVGQLQQILPRLRVVISGRGLHPDSRTQEEVTDLVEALAKSVKPLELEELKEDESLQLLRSLGLKNARTNLAIVRRVGGHPLSLRLAAQLVEVVARRLNKLVAEVTSTDIAVKEWLDHMSEGLLYRRIVAHMPDESLQKLADPGLVLREITPDVIFHVLNQPCELGLQQLDEAIALFERLKQFNQLVCIQSSDVVRHRPELRQRVLKEMQHHYPETCRAIWSAAAQYYERCDEGRLEELYCRLMLDEPVGRLNERWQVGLEKGLLRSRAEMPQRARQFFDLMVLIAEGRSKIENLQSASDVNQARLVEEMKMLLARGNAQEALEVLQTTSAAKEPHFNTSLFPVHVRAVAQSGDLERAGEMALAGLDYLEKDGKHSRPRYKELLLIGCQIALTLQSRLTGQLTPNSQETLQEMLPQLCAKGLFERFLKVVSHYGRQVLDLRIAIALLELFDTEWMVKPDNKASEVELARACAMHASDVLRRLRPAYFGVDGGLLVRSAAVLSAYGDLMPDVRELLEVPQAHSVLLRDYAGEGLDRLVSKEPVEIKHSMPTVSEQLGRMLRQMIRLRDRKGR
jgi:GTPase SAR1 family protein